MKRLFKYVGVILMLVSILTFLISIIMMTTGKFVERETAMVIFACSLLSIFVSGIIMDGTW